MKRDDDDENRKKEFRRRRHFFSFHVGFSCSAVATTMMQTLAAQKEEAATIWTRGRPFAE